MVGKYKHILLASLVAVFVAFSASALIPSNTVYADHPGQCSADELAVGATQERNDSTDPPTITCKTNPTPGGGGSSVQESPAPNDNPTCAIEKLGWVLCPLIETAGRIGDQSFQMLAKHFLETEPELVASMNGRGGASGTYIAWELARNIANIMFILAFLVIIYSQVTGAGLNNYGIKKLLPRLIVAVIAVNLSFYICQAMVDLTNILGYEIQNFMVDTASQVSNRAALAVPAQSGIIDNQTSGGVLGTIALGTLGIAGAVWFLLPMLFLGVSTVVITCIVILVILLMRKAFIVLLVVASPVAFVLYLLPNTERYFRKWASMFWQLLLVFPIVGLLFGGGQLASAIVLVAGTGNATDSTTISASNPNRNVYADDSGKCIQLPSSNPKASEEERKARVADCGTNSTPFLLGLVAAGIAVAPMIAVWAVLKGALSAAGAIGGKIGGAIQGAGNRTNSIARKPEDLARKQAWNAAKTGVATRALNNNWRGARFARRWQKRGEERQSAFEAAKAGFDASEAGAGDLSQKIMRNKAAASAAHEGLQEQYIKSLNAEKLDIGDALGKNVGVAEKGIESQATRAMAEAVKAIKDATDTTNLSNIEQSFEQALRNKDVATARAMQDILLTSGSAGMKAFHSAYARAGVTGGSAIDTSLRQNVLSNHGAAKSADTSIKMWSEKGGQSLDKYWEDSNTWNDVDTVQKFASLSKTAQRQAYAKMDTAQMNAIINGLKASPDALKSIDLGIRQNHNM